MAAEAPAAAAEAPPGRLVCRAKSPFGVMNELFLDGSGSRAAGALRSVAPSGMITVRHVRAERLGTMLIADDPSETDLVVHAAIVRPIDGKSYMRLGDRDESWSPCE